MELCSTIILRDASSFFDKLYSVYVAIYIPKHLKFQQNVIEYKQAMSLVDVYLNMSI